MGQNERLKRVVVLSLLFFLIINYNILAERKSVIKIGIHRDVRPIEFYDKKNKPCGLNVDILHNIFSDNTYNIEWRTITENNKFNIIHCETPKKDLKGKFYFSKLPILNIYGIIVVKDDTYYISKLEDLNGHTVAVKSDCAIENILKNESPYAVLIKVDSIKEGFNLLKNGKTVAFVGNEYSLLYELGKNKITGVKIIGDPIYIGGLHIVIPKTDRNIVDYIDKKLEHFLKTKNYKKIVNKWLGEDLYKIRRNQKIFKYLVIVIDILLGLIIIIVFFNKGLKREVKRKLEKVNKLENRYYNLIQTAPIGVITIDDNYNIITFNKSAEKILYTNSDEVKAAGNIFKLPFFFKQNSEHIKKYIQSIIDLRDSKSDVFEFVTENNDKIILKIIGFLSDFVKGNFYITLFLLDITELEKAKMELIYTSKMDAIGRFTSGITHDFNNIMTGILSLVELIKSTKNISDEVLEDINSIENFANKAVNLTKKLLGFTKKQEFSPVITNLNVLVEKNLSFIMRIIKENIKLEKQLEPNLYKCKIDPTHLEQILLNLTHNSIDAMSKNGGRIILETKNVKVDKNNSKNFYPLLSGEYVMLSFSDTGEGIPEDIIDKIFDPFFSTKQKGNGFGLSIVYNIVKLNNGFIKVYSEQNKGTAFKIFFPAIVSKQKENNSVTKAKEEHNFNEIVVMVVEDNEEIKDLIHRNLKLNNITVFSFTSGIDAIKFVQENKDIRIDLLISDLILKDTDGNQLAFEIKKILPDLKVLYMSGYTKNVVLEYGIAPEDANFIQKPFTMENLLDKIKDIFL